MQREWNEHGWLTVGCGRCAEPAVELGDSIDNRLVPPLGPGGTLPEQIGLAGEVIRMVAPRDDIDVVIL